MYWENTFKNRVLIKLLIVDTPYTSQLLYNKEKELNIEKLFAAGWQMLP